jgi:hypothetical protein
MRAVNTHVLVPGELTRESLREALAEGRGYLCHEIFGEGHGFVCEARAVGGAVVARLGEDRPFADGLALHVEAPLAARARLFRDGRVVAAPPGEARAWTFPLGAPGVYRVELTIADSADDGRVRPWIYANPIYLRAAPERRPGGESF